MLCETEMARRCFATFKHRASLDFCSAPDTVLVFPLRLALDVSSYYVILTLELFGVGRRTKSIGERFELSGNKVIADI